MDLTPLAPLRRVRSVSQGSGGASGSQRRCKEEIQRILAGIQAPLARPLLRSLLARLGGVFLPPRDEAEGLAGAVLAAHPNVGAHSPCLQALGMFGILRVALGAGLRNRGCARVDFGQPFSLQEFVAQGGWIHVEPRPEEPPGAPGTTHHLLFRCHSRGDHICAAAAQAPWACAIRALLLELLPFLGSSAGRPGIVLSQDELQRKTLELLRLLPPNLLGLQPCQPPERRSHDVLDKLLLCGLLEVEEPEGERWACDVSRRPWARMDFSDSDSDGTDELPKRCFKLSEPQGCPGFLLFLCRLLSPVLGTFARAVTFLERPQWPQPEAVCLEALLQFLAEGDDVEPPSRSAALSALQTFKDMGVLEELRGPAGPQLQLTQPFRSTAARTELETFVRQFLQM
ncbi:hypothetical protein Q9233_016286 [Columba guinea]|nr:hypothetical protein Q9233_016286 [Columba guinea]